MKDYYGKDATRLKEKKLFLFDMDGTIYLDNDLFDGTMDFITARERIKKNTRVYAKKQMTWYAKDPDIIYLHPSTAVTEILNQL